ncbi:PREDICTED: ubiquitin carboxyl-terminal hydrolase 18 isoform X1 [Camelina sativa]|uniref:Ubiquitin carboxyl-terminal hydrolase 18 isoform X1 n=1 Tax=Camelina sativa TaxID=90675 RepID=A0ABM0UWV7_CAMSA|nr:PREDICTED: ubiquitin carboxyl-terminal hydrolase 18 isoform X1 [Camelina sativa]
MHEVGFPVDLSVFTRLIATLFFLAVGVFYFLRNTAARYFDIGAAAAGGFDREFFPVDTESFSSEKCSRCKSVRYCSAECQSSDWSSGHQRKCRDDGITTLTSFAKNGLRFRASPFGNISASDIALVPDQGRSKSILKLREVLFPYEEFVRYFNWDNPELAPCGLMNCGNSCFANVILQCLSWTRPLVAYLLEKGHKSECMRNDWCFFCEFQTHVERASQSRFPFSPMNIISRLTNIGGTLGYGRQEDAHEFMRYAIDMMQSVCLDEFGGEKIVPPRSQETTLIQYIFGGLLQSQVQCTVCNHVSDQYENIMDLIVEMHGGAVSLEECLDQFTAVEWLQGDNMYNCDRCSDYVKACKRLTIRLAPNILTIALKRYQGGRYGKLNKRISFPETLDLNPYMSEGGEGSDVYKLYAVIVHLDMLNASFFGHYICYIKDFCGNWYRIDDSEIESVELEDVLSQRAYMLLYSRIQARSSSSCLRSEVQEERNTDVLDTEPCLEELVESSMVGAIENRSSIHATIEDPECEQESSSSSASSPSSSSSSSPSPLSSSSPPSVVTSECCSEVERVDTLDSESNPSNDDDSATDHREDAANGNKDPEVKYQAVYSCSDPTTSTPLVCTKSKPPVRDMDTEMMDAQ